MRPVLVSSRAEPVRRNRLLALLPPADFSLLAPHLKEVPIERGAVLHEPGDQILHVYFPHSGMISVVAVMRDGDAVETATVGREGAIAASAGLGARIASARAIVQLPGMASRISTLRFGEAVDQSLGLRDLVVQYNEVLLAQVQQSVACNALHDVEARLCRWLLQTRDRMDSDTLPLTQEFLAQMLGVRRTTVTLVARILQSAGMIRYRRGQIEICDRIALEEGACECYLAVRQQIEQVFPDINAMTQ
jgi:CRP-like cAMP-binding protein